jgi:hypothetical protein
MENSVEKWMKEWVDRTSQVKYENSFNENSDEWIEIEGIGRFKGLEIVSEEHKIYFLYLLLYLVSKILYNGKNQNNTTRIT